MLLLLITHLATARHQLDNALLDTPKDLKSDVEDTAWHGVGSDTARGIQDATKTAPQWDAAAVPVPAKTPPQQGIYRPPQVAGAM